MVILCSVCQCQSLPELAYCFYMLPWAVQMWKAVHSTWFCALGGITIGCLISQEEMVLHNNKNHRHQTPTRMVFSSAFRPWLIWTVNICRHMTATLRNRKPLCMKLSIEQVSVTWWCGTPFQAIYYLHVSAFVLFMLCAWNNLCLFSCILYVQPILFCK